MQIKLLGPLEVRDQDGVVDLGGGRRRALLAMLALNAGRVVAAERLVELLWRDAPPPSATNALQVHISTLRKALEPDGPPYRVLLSQTPGYVLNADQGQIDSLRFEQLAARGRQALVEGNPDVAAQLLKEAGALWRGAALTGFEHEPWAVAEAMRLD